MGFCSQFKALFKKNLILWYRNLCGSLCEILFPVVLMFLIVLVRKLVNDEDVQAQSYIESPGLSYYYDQTVKTNLTKNSTGTPQMGLYPGNPFTSCVGFNRLRFAFVGNHPLYSKIEEALLSPTGRNLIHA